MNFLEKINTTKSVVVLASYRTGSTALCDVVAKHIGARDLQEFFHDTFKSETFNAIWTLKDHKTVLKIQPDQLDNVGMYWNQVFSNAQVVRLRRKDIIDQISSFYVCHMVNRWHETKDIVQNLDYEVAIDLDSIRNSVSYIRNMNNKLSNLDNIVDLDLYYEEIASELDPSDYVRFQKPRNFHTVKMLVQQALDIEEASCQK